MLIQINTNDEIKILNETVEYKTLKKYIGGYIQLVPLEPWFCNIFPGIEAICDEEGKLKGLPINNIASILSNQIIVGNIVFVNTGEDDFTDLTEEQANDLKSFFEFAQNFIDLYEQKEE